MIALPLLMSMGIAKGIDPLLMGMPAAICSSYAFSLPISTPPNAIIFGTNRITISDMLRAGIIMNILGIVAVMTLGWFLIKNLLLKGL
jgi:sodium-dependent dicarboxylate transporter 2/3/5